MDHPGTQTACSPTDTETTKKESWALLMRSPPQNKNNNKKKKYRHSRVRAASSSALQNAVKNTSLLLFCLRGRLQVFFFFSTCPSTSRESWVSYYQRQLSSALQCGRVTWNTCEEKKKKACVQNRAISLQLSPKHRHTLGLHKDKLSTSAGKKKKKKSKTNKNAGNIKTKNKKQHNTNTAQHSTTAIGWT